MRTFSEDIQQKSAGDQRRLYTLFQRAVKSGSFQALKLLSRFELTGSKGQARQVHDYAYTDATAQLITEWMSQQVQTRSARGLRREDLAGLSDADLSALIERQQEPQKRIKPKRKRKARATLPSSSPAQVTTGEHVADPVQVTASKGT